MQEYTEQIVIQQNFKLKLPDQITIVQVAPVRNFLQLNGEGKMGWCHPPSAKMQYLQIEVKIDHTVV